MLHKLHRALDACFGQMTRAGASVRAFVCKTLFTRSETGCETVKINSSAARLPVSVGHLFVNRRAYWKTLLYVLLLMPINAMAVTPPGTLISNTAAAAFDAGAGIININSNTVSVTSTIITTNSTIALYRYDPAGALSEQVPTQHATSGPPGAGFVVSPNPSVTAIGGVTVLDPNLPVNMSLMTAAVAYHTGEPVFIWLQDLDQNLDALTQETIVVTVVSSTGDQEALILTETDINTGIFMGYVQSSSNPVTQYDGVITLGPDSSVTVNYVDQFDATDTSVAVSLIDSRGRVFDSSNGALLDGMTVTILDDLGNPAAVFGDDGVSAFPNSVTTGGSVTDGGGAVYNFPTGRYRFPLLAPGNYQIVVTVPASYSVPSLAGIAALQALPGAPYALDVNASFGNVFTLTAGTSLRADIPVDPLAATLVLTKTTSKAHAAVGDFVQYKLRLENTDNVAVSNNVVLTDVLPAGFRYQPNSVRLNGVATTEPVMTSDGRTMQFNIATLPALTSLEFTYVTEITVATKAGDAINTAGAVDALNIASNTAQAKVTVTEDLISSRSFIMGRVVLGDCSDDESKLPGLPNTKIYMEDGTYVVTDENGLYHFEGVTPGSHVVQVDLVTIPDNLEIISCEENTRFAGTPYSQFVELQGGSMWRANFYVSAKDPITDQATLYLESELNNEEVKYTVELTNGKVSVSNYRLMVQLPDRISYLPGSSFVNGMNIDDPEVSGQVLIYRMGEPGTNWSKQLRFRARLKDKADGELETKAFVMLSTDTVQNLRSEAVINKLGVNRGRVEERDMVFSARFKPMGVELTDRSKKQIRDAIERLGDVDIRLNQVVGHADGHTVANRSKWLHRSNDALSLARAHAVSEFLVNELNVDARTVITEGKGDREPVDSNDTVEGRATNRRANLYLTTSEIVDPGNIELVIPRSEVELIELTGQPEYKFNELYNPVPIVEQEGISKYDEFWINKTDPGTEWIMPAGDYYPAIPAVNLAIKHHPNDKYTMLHNGKELNPLFYFGTIKNRNKTVARSYWQGVHLHAGENKFEFVIKDESGKIKQRLTRTVVYADVPVRAEFVAEYSRLVADGTNPPVIALRMHDAHGYKARPGVVGKFELNSPYITKQELNALDDDRLTGLDRDKPHYRIGADGIALIELEPTAETGKVIVDLSLTGNSSQKIEAWLQPDMRDWILVGLAEGTVGYGTVSGSMQGLGENDYRDGYYDDGKLAFFAKGRIKGDMLLTTSFDSSKGKHGSDNRVNQLIDPDTYYTIYGDATMQRHETSTAEKLYIKVEREGFYALYGDYDTGLTLTELSKYSRRVTGIKSEMHSDNFSYNVFASEALNKFTKSEIRGDGTSGLYRFTGNDIVINSETIVLETRDRFRSDIIIDRKELKRHIDYSIDYQDGTIYFRQPIASNDGNFNPIFIVADYEVEAPVKGDVNFGGRAAVRLMDNKLEVGGTIVHDSTFGADGDLIGADATLQLSEENELKVEIAGTNGNAAGVGVSGTAMLSEIKHEGEDLQGRVYFKQQDDTFGLGQQSASQSGTRKYGAEGRYKMSERTTVDALVYHEDNRTTDAKRDVSEAKVTYGNDPYMLSAGARTARDDDGAGNKLDSDLLLLGAGTRLFDNRLRLRANSEFALSDADDSADYPSRHILGVDFFLTSTIDLYTEREWTIGEDQDTEMTRAGLRATPWQGAKFDSSVNREVQENGVRAFATMGLTQSFRISERWTGDAALDKTKTIRHTGVTPFDADVPVAQGTLSDDFTAVSVGVTYTGNTFTLANRFETRNSELEHKVGAVINWERNLIDGIGYAVSAQLFDARRSDDSSTRDGNIRLSLGYRPLSSNWIMLNRLEYKHNEEVPVLGSRFKQKKLVDNFVGNYKPNRRHQLSVNYGIKYVVDSFDGEEFNGTTHLLGSEYRYDISKTIDIGLHEHILYSVNSSNYLYSTGLSAGFSIAKNVWLSIGYNFDGFEDRDFSAAGYTAEGPYIRFRMKFDQDTASEILDWLR